MEYDRAFYWGVHDVRLDKQAKELFFTFSANIAYAVGRDLRLEVYMIKEDHIWKFQDFGSLYIEKFGESPEVIIKNEQFLKKYSDLFPIVKRPPRIIRGHLKSLSNPTSSSQ